MSELTSFGYVRVGKWSRCAHCWGVFAGEHYCGAPWQPDPGFGLDGVSQQWRDEMPHARLAALEAEHATLRAYAKHLETCEMCAVHGVDLCFMGSEYRDAARAALATPAGGQG